MKKEFLNIGRKELRKHRSGNDFGTRIWVPKVSLTVFQVGYGDVWIKRVIGILKLIFREAVSDIKITNKRVVSPHDEEQQGSTECIFSIIN